MAWAAAGASVNFSFVAIDCSCCEPLASTQNRDRQFFRLGRGQTENDVLGRLFQRLQQRVRRFLRQHVHFVDDINFETRFRRRVANVVAQLPHVIDPAIARCVQLNDIEAVSAGDFATIIAFATWRHCRPPLRAIERFRQDAGG